MKEIKRKREKGNKLKQSLKGKEKNINNKIG
jgi:hypothetical protein